MSEVMIEPATAERWDDVQHALTGGGDGKSCQCAWWTLTNADFNKTSADERRELLRDEIQAGPPPGLIAYVDGEPAGWVRIGPRTAQVRLSRTRNIVSTTTEPLDDPSVWAVTCFVVRREHRKQGLTTALLEAAVDYAKDAGARMIEAYPVDTSTGTHRSNELYIGTLATFLAAGFTETGLRKPGRPLVALSLAA
ncbi:GNAT family N-acetyltransferase [Microbacterium sp. NIBRBAC000506063]|uniref:GNAT family N-acetyltransferase n=1 Tax=Microbacterium sp. NIBRBAC000506063 TaxID=2734618 RepID=UPI001BB5C0A1|nr:GNAT family N-acetyltransferase [Microbacterium sp. NIBRBAC000506063]QTV79753.1 GNAT family N-acetyltransferase [Microbacterium sp. NIBRBAC000506063]